MRLPIWVLGAVISATAAAQGTPPAAPPPRKAAPARPDGGVAGPAAAATRPAALPRKPRAPAIGQLGTSKEDEASEPAAPPPRSGRGHPWEYPHATEADTALLRALLYAFEPAPEEIRVIAIEDLALLGDARALNPLAQLVFDANGNVQVAALRTISHFQTPRAEEILENVVRHPRLADSLKQWALRGLELQSTPRAKAFLAEVETNTRYPWPVRTAAHAARQDLDAPPPAPSATPFSPVPSR